MRLNTQEIMVQPTRNIFQHFFYSVTYLHKAAVVIILVTIIPFEITLTETATTQVSIPTPQDLDRIYCVRSRPCELGQLLICGKRSLWTLNITSESITLDSWGVVAGNRKRTGFLNHDTNPQHAKFDGIRDVIKDPVAHRLLLTDSGNHCVRSIDFGGFGVSTYAGKCREHGSVEDGQTRTTMRLYNPHAMLTVQKTVIIADTLNGAIRIIDEDGRVRTIKIDIIVGTVEYREHPFYMAIWYVDQNNTGSLTAALTTSGSIVYMNFTAQRQRNDSSLDLTVQEITPSCDPRFTNNCSQIENQISIMPGNRELVYANAKKDCIFKYNLDSRRSSCLLNVTDATSFLHHPNGWLYVGTINGDMTQSNTSSPAPPSTTPAPKCTTLTTPAPTTTVTPAPTTIVWLTVGVTDRSNDITVTAIMIGTIIFACVLVACTVLAFLARSRRLKLKERCCAQSNDDSASDMREIAVNLDITQLPLPSLPTSTRNDATPYSQYYRLNEANMDPLLGPSSNEETSLLNTTAFDYSLHDNMEEPPHSYEALALDQMDDITEDLTNWVQPPYLVDQEDISAEVSAFPLHA